MKNIRVAIAHDYLTQRGGAERVVLALANAFPDAMIYTTLYEPEATYPEFKDITIRTTCLNKVASFRRNHRNALPFLPFASSLVKIDADVVIASSSGWAHGFRTNGKMLVYCHTPARWLYDTDRYLGTQSSVIKRTALRLLRPLLRSWDQRSAASADIYYANSTMIQRRIHRCYGIDAKVVFPPFAAIVANTDSISDIVPCSPGYLLVVSRLMAYKNVDKIVEAFAERPHLRLVIVGTGPQERHLKQLAPENVTILANLTDSELAAAYANAYGLIAASYEDFGLTPLEAAAHGKPTAALRWGGFLDTIIDGKTGVFFDRPTSLEIGAAIDRMLTIPWDKPKLVARSAEFTEAIFAHHLRKAVNAIFAEASK